MLPLGEQYVKHGEVSALPVARSQTHGIWSEYPYTVFDTDAGRLDNADNLVTIFRRLRSVSSR